MSETETKTQDEDVDGEGSTDLAEIHSAAKSQFDRIQSIMKDERDQCLQDRRFYSIAGAQWEGPLSEQFENKPKLEVNKVHLSVIRIFNEYRNNRITVNFIPKDGSDGGDLSDTCNGLYRADEQKSVAREAYDNCFEEGVGGGFGAFRLRNDYEDEEDEENEKQCIYIEPIFDADSSVYFDPDAKRQDKSDAGYCFVLSSMTKDKFQDEYPDAMMPVSMPKSTETLQFDWYTVDVVYIAEYYKVEKVNVTQVKYKGLSGEIRKFDQEELDEDSSIKKGLATEGFKKVLTRVIKQRKIHKYIMSGSEIVEDLGYVAGKYIPIVPFYGKRWFIDNVERCMGHVRLAKDTQRLKNMQISKLAEISALSTIEKPIFTPEQISGHQLLWANDNIVNNPYLLVNPMTDPNGQQLSQGPIAYTKVANIPPAMAAIMQFADQDLSDLLGNQEAGEVLSPNTSGVAIDLVQSKLDMQTFIYLDNMSNAVECAGKIWLSMASEIYVEEGRKRKTINEAGEASTVELNTKGMDKSTGVMVDKNNLTEVDFDVVAKPGPTSVSKKAATVRALINLLQVSQDPETVQVLTAMIMMNMEGEGIAEIRDYFRKKLLTMGVAKPTPEEEAEMKKAQEAQAQQPPDANTQLALSMAKQADADALKKQADTVKVSADAEKSKAETMQILQDLHAGKIETVMGAIERMQEVALKGAAPQTPIAPIAQPPETPPQHIVQIPQ